MKINAPHTKTENASSDIFGTCFYLFPVGKKTLIFRAPSKEHLYQVWFQLAQWFQRRRLQFLMITDNGWNLTTIACIILDLFPTPSLVWTHASYIYWKFANQSSFQPKFLSRRFWCFFIICLISINLLKKPKICCTTQCHVAATNHFFFYF